MKGKNLAKLLGGLILLGIVVLVAFYWLNNRSDDSVFSKDGETNTEAQKILSKDLDRNYPASVREVVRLYARITKCWYSERISEGEFSELAKMQHGLFDEELAEENPLIGFTERLKNEVIAAGEEKKTISSYQVQKESSVKKWKTEEDSFASIVVCFVTKINKKGFEYTYEEFLLREDEKGQWKIVGWQKTEPIEIED